MRLRCFQSCDVLCVVVVFRKKNKNNIVVQIESVFLSAQHFLSNLKLIGQTMDEQVDDMDEISGWSDLPEPIFLQILS